MALWRTRTLTPDQKAEIVEEQQDQEERPITLEEVGSILDVEDANMSKIYTAELPISVNFGVFDPNRIYLLFILCIQELKTAQIFLGSASMTMTMTP